MTPDVERFLAQIRADPKFIAGVASDPRVLADFEEAESGLRSVYARGTDDPRLIEFWDDVRRAVARDDAIKARPSSSDASRRQHARSTGQTGSRARPSTVGTKGNYRPA
jgi:hypothetical protein